MRLSTRTPRRAATLVETAVVVLIFLTFVYAVFEYGRFVLLENLMVAASREGCRYALVHSQDATVVTDVQNVAKQRMGGEDAQFPDLAVTVFATDNPSANLNTLNPDDPITVQVSGTFKPILASLGFLPVSFTMKSASIMTCEGN